MSNNPKHLSVIPLNTRNKNMNLLLLALGPKTISIRKTWVSNPERNKNYTINILITGLKILN